MKKHLKRILNIYFRAKIVDLLVCYFNSMEFMVDIYQNYWKYAPFINGKIKMMVTWWRIYFLCIYFSAAVEIFV